METLFNLTLQSATQFHFAIVSSTYKFPCLLNYFDLHFIVSVYCTCKKIRTTKAFRPAGMHQTLRIIIRTEVFSFSFFFFIFFVFFFSCQVFPFSRRHSHDSRPRNKSVSGRALGYISSRAEGNGIRGEHQRDKVRERERERELIRVGSRLFTRTVRDVFTPRIRDVYVDHPRIV